MFATIVSLSAGAWANTKVLRFARATPLPGHLASLPQAVSERLARALKATAVDDTVIAHGCGGGQHRCLAVLASDLGATELVFGVIRIRSRETIEITVERFSRARGLRQERFSVEAGEPIDIAADLVEAARPMFTEESPPERDAPERDTRERDTRERNAPERDAPERNALGDTPRPESPHEPPGRISGGTYALIGGGLAGVAAGGVFVMASRALNSQITSAPTATPDDFLRLRQLELAAQTRMQIGEVLMVAGGAVAIAGVVRAVIQKQDSPSEPQLAVAPISGGAALVFSGALP